MSDLPSRLRAAAESPHDNSHLHLEAADEIERLQREAGALRAEIDRADAYAQRLEQRATAGWDLP